MGRLPTGAELPTVTADALDKILIYDASNSNQPGLATIDSIKSVSGSGVWTTGSFTGIVTFSVPNLYNNETTIIAFATGGQGSAVALTGEYSNVTTVASDFDSVKLLTAAAGQIQTVKNSGASILSVFPNTSDSINAMAVNLSVDIPIGGEMTFRAISAAVWETVESFYSSGPSTQNGGLELLGADNSGNTIVRLTNTSHGQATVVTFNDVGLATSFVAQSTNALTAAEVDALDVGTRHVDMGDVDTHVLLVADSGKTHTIPQVTGDIAITLPAASAGLEYPIVSGAATAEGDNWVITATNDFIGGLTQVDTDGSAAAVLASGSSTNTCTIVAPLAGTSIRMICDGTDWLISGFVLAIAVPTFTDV